VQPKFARGVALLHSFFYEEARRIFTAVAEQDPNCAMAQWGIAMTWWHPIWSAPTPDEMRAGKAAADKAMTMPGGTDRERRFIAAISTYYNTADNPVSGPVGQSCHGPVGPRERVVAYEKVMRDLRAAYPDDYEAQAFYALALLAVGYATPADTTLSNQLAAAEILEKLWKQNPNHPGAVHYLIHSYDYPSLAERGLPAAQAYAAIAPWVPHALHMPSHIFTRLGLWDESIAANLNAAAASRAYAAKRHRTATEAEELHALDYLVYSYLQEGRDGDAKKVVDFVRTVRKTNPELEFSAAYGLAASPARYALERKDWAAAATLPIPDLPHWNKFPFLEGMTEYAHAIGRARQGDVAGARVAMDRMRQLREATTDIKFNYFRMHLEQQLRAVAAWVASAEGKKDEALAGLRSAADAEDVLGKNPVSPGALVPVREQLGDLLLELSRPKEALAAYEAALKIYPGRFQGLYGAALAAERSGDQAVAHKYYAQLAKQTLKANGSRPELKHVREFLAANSESAPLLVAGGPLGDAGPR
jgi:tetratricopeptide (TPR) repeat protein